MSKALAHFKILVVEDDKDLLEATCELFDHKGFTTFSADNGQSAGKILDREKIDVVFSDIQMPVMTGFELLKSIREKDPLLPIVVLVTGQSEYTEEIVIAQGASALLRKPFRLEVAFETIMNQLVAK